MSHLGVFLFVSLQSFDQYAPDNANVTFNLTITDFPRVRQDTICRLISQGVIVSEYSSCELSLSLT